MFATLPTSRRVYFASTPRHDH